MELVVKFTLRPYLPKDIISVPPEYEVGWAQVPVCTLRRTGKGEYIAPIGVRNQEVPSKLVAVQILLLLQSTIEFYLQFVEIWW